MTDQFLNEPDANRYVLLRDGGLAAIDNTLWSGHVADPSHGDEDTVALRKLNEKIRADARVDMCLMSVGDGVTLARKRGAAEH